MKTPGIRTLLASASLLALTAGPGSSAYGNFGTGRPAVYAPVETVLPVATSYVVPTTFALSTTSYVAPTSYVVPSSYVLPSSYVYPTSFLATSAVAPSVYATVYESATYVPSSYVVPTSYAYRPRPFLAPRRWVERPVYATSSSLYVPTTTRYTPTTYYATSFSLTPTTYVYPTIYDAPVIATVATADACCLESAATRPAAPAPTSGTTTAPANTLKRAPARPSTVESTVASPEERREEPPAEAATPAPPAPAAVAPAETKPEPDTLPPPVSLPVAPEAPAERSTAPPVEKLPLPAGPESKEVIPPPLAPADGTTPPVPQAPTAPGGEPTDRYKVQRPAYPIDSNVRFSRTPSAADRYSVNRPTYESEKLRQAGNILKGKVRSGDTGELEEGVQVILSNRTNAFADRVIATDAYGRYAVRLPAGDWTVKVVMPSGRAYVVSELTITGDRITDDLGRNVPSLTITR